MDKELMEIISANIGEYNFKLEKQESQLSTLYSITGMSEFIMENMFSPNFLKMINTNIIEIFDITYSSIYLYNKRKLTLAVSNLENTSHHYEILKYVEKNNNKKYFLNEPHDIFLTVNTKSLIGVPIKNNGLLGYIIVEHVLPNTLDIATLNNLELLSNLISMGLENNRLFKMVKVSSERDSLTKLFNREYFFKEVAKQISLSSFGYTIVMIDIDHFKKCNDTYGHLYGDAVLASTASTIKSCVRKDDVVARYGGEEIVVYFDSMADVNIAINKAEHIRQAVESNIIEYAGIKSGVTISLGVCITLKSEQLEKVVEKSDKMLYKSKNTGRNKVSVSLY